MIKPKKILVIGGNAAGPAAAAKAKRVNPEAEVIMFEAGEYISTGTCELPYVLAGDIESYEKLVFYDEESFKKEKGVNVFTKHLIQNINTKEKYITVKNLKFNAERKYDYDSLVIATGSVCKIPAQFKGEYENVFTLKNIKDFISIQNYIDKNKVENIIIVGAGYIGLEAADALKKRNYEITILDKETLPLSSSEFEIQKMIVESLEKNNIRFIGSINNYKTIIDNNLITKINIDGRIIESDLIILATGFSPNNFLAKNSGIKIGMTGGIQVDRLLMTSANNVFAAGDCIEISNSVTNKPFYFPIATVARDYGHIAGANAAGEFNRVEPVVKNIAFKIFDKFNVEVGISSKEAEIFKLNFKEVSSTVPNLVKVMPESSEVFGKILYETNSKKILGASFLGGKEVSGYGDLISTLIKTGQTIEVLGKINYNYTPPLSPFINLLSVLGRKIK